MYLYDAAAHRVSAARAVTLASVRSHLADKGAAAEMQQSQRRCAGARGSARAAPVDAAGLWCQARPRTLTLRLPLETSRADRLPDR